MSSTAWPCPIGCNLKGQQWLALPASYKPDPRKINDKFKGIVAPRFEKIGHFWSELSSNTKRGVSIAATLILTASVPYFFVTGILLGGTVLACCIIGKSAADSIKKNELKKCCFEFEDFLALFKENCEQFLEKIENNSLTSEDIQKFQELRIHSVSFQKINEHLEGLEIKLQDVYEDRLPFSHCIYELRDSTGYFLADFETWNDDKDDLKIFKENAQLSLKGKPSEGNLGLILRLNRAHANVQAFRCGL